MNSKDPSPRRSLLDLAPLELDCMNTLWPMGAGTVREIRDRLFERRPRAYTTIMTIMDRLARKGVVERCKSGRAYVYRPNLSAEDARAQAVGQVVEGFFGGSTEALLAQLSGASPVSPDGETLAPEGLSRAAVAAATAASASRASTEKGDRADAALPLRKIGAVATRAPIAEDRIDDTLL